MRTKQKRPLYEIASDIYRTWAKINYAAVPYLQAMENLESIDDKYFYDSGASIVRYFLANAGTWKGESAKLIKKELRAML